MLSLCVDHAIHLSRGVNSCRTLFSLLGNFLQLNFMQHEQTARLLSLFRCYTTRLACAFFVEKHSCAQPLPAMVRMLIATYLPCPTPCL